MPDRFKLGDQIHVQQDGVDDYNLLLTEREAAIANAVSALVEGEINAAARKLENFEASIHTVLPDEEGWDLNYDYTMGWVSSPGEFCTALRATNQQEAGA